VSDEARIPAGSAAQRLRNAKRHARDLLLSLDGVQGVGVGDGTVRVYLRDATVAHSLPGAVDGIPLEPVVVGDVITY